MKKLPFTLILLFLALILTLAASSSDHSLAESSLNRHLSPLRCRRPQELGTLFGEAQAHCVT